MKTFWVHLPYAIEIRDIWTIYFLENNGVWLTKLWFHGVPKKKVNSFYSGRRPCFCPSLEKCHIISSLERSDFFEYARISKKIWRKKSFSIQTLFIPTCYIYIPNQVRWHIPQRRHTVTWRRIIFQVFSRCCPFYYTHTYIYRGIHTYTASRIRISGR